MKIPNIIAEKIPETLEMQVAKYISTFLHPFVLGPLVFLYFSLHDTDNVWFGWMVWFITFIANNVITGVYLTRMKRIGMTSSIDVPERLLRQKPYIISIFGYIFASILLYIIEAPIIVVAMMLIYAVNSAIATMINQWWKISIHGMAVSGTMVPFIYLYGGYWWFALALFPAMVFSRTRLKAHTTSQVIAGITLAFILTWIQLELWI
jgi:membrane-associated phospholipid phosphatase